MTSPTDRPSIDDYTTAVVTPEDGAVAILRRIGFSDDGIAAKRDRNDHLWRNAVEDAKTVLRLAHARSLTPGETAALDRALERSLSATADMDGTKRRPRYRFDPVADGWVRIEQEAQP